MICLLVFFFFQKKKQKAFVLLRRRLWATQPSAKRNHGGLGAGPQKTRPDVVNWAGSSLLFPEKEAKSVCSASQKVMGYLTFREAEPRGFGGWPPKKPELVLLIEWFSSFSRKRSKKRLFCFAEGYGLLVF
jgi:hypothetical protein